MDGRFSVKSGRAPTMSSSCHDSRLARRHSSFPSSAWASGNRSDKSAEFQSGRWTPGWGRRIYHGPADQTGAETVRIVQARDAAGWEPGVFSVAKFELVKQGTTTKIGFDHTGFPSGAGRALAAGWHKNYWEPLRKFLPRTSR